MIPTSFRTVFCSVAAVLAGLSICIASVANAAPSVSGSVAVEDDILRFSITGSELPELRSITVSCTYDPQRAVLTEAIISSPLPSTAFSALIDTSEQSLTVSLHATSTIQVADGTSLIVLKIPLAVSQEAENAFILNTATVIDASGESRSLLIDTTSVLLPPNYPVGTSTILQKGYGVAGYYQLNGRHCRSSLPLSVPGYLIRRTTNRNLSRGTITIR